MSERAEQISDVMNQLQIVRFQIEAIASQPEKKELNQQRANQACKSLRRLETELSELFANPEPAARDHNGPLGAREDQVSR